LSISVVRALPEDEWRRFVADHPAGNVFHTPEMFEVFRRSRGHRPELWAAVDDGHALALLLPVRIALAGGWLSRPTTRAVVYGGVLPALEAEGQQALSLLLQTYAQESARKVLFTELRNVRNSEETLQTLSQCGFVHEHHLNFLIDLQRPAEEILRSIGPRTRKKIRHATRQGAVKVEEVRDARDLAVCYGLLRRTYRAARVPLADRSLFEAAREVLQPKGMARFSLARVGGTPAAVSVELLYKQTMFGWYGGTDRSCGRYYPTELLTWEVLRWGAENGYRLYDFGGAGRPDEAYGVRDFKAKFGGELVDHGRDTWVPSHSLFLLGKMCYALYQRLGLRGNRATSDHGIGTGRSHASR
jgi:lipid II:glycine glycyltransferase (peptidoglycan interpeptide bridge formation enzyme)